MNTIILNIPKEELKELYKKYGVKSEDEITDHSMILNTYLMYKDIVEGEYNSGKQNIPGGQELHFPAILYCRHTSNKSAFEID